MAVSRRVKMLASDSPELTENKLCAFTRIDKDQLNLFKEMVMHTAVVNGALELLCSFVLSGEIMVTKKEHDVSDDIKRVINTEWKSMLRSIILELHVAGMALICVNPEKKVSWIDLTTVNVEYYVEIDGQYEYRIVSDMTLSQLASTISPRTGLTRQQIIDQSTFFLVIVSPPDQNTEFGYVPSKMRALAEFEAFAALVRRCTSVSVQERANPVVLTEFAEVKAEDANAPRDYGRMGEGATHQRQAERVARSYRQAAGQAANQAAANALASQPTADLVDVDASKPIRDKTTGLRMYPRVVPQWRPRFLPLDPGSKAGKLDQPEEPHTTMAEANGDLALAVANTIGTPAALMAADNTKTNASVSDAQWTLMKVTLNRTREILTYVVEYLFLLVYGKEHITHAALVRTLRMSKRRAAKRAERREAKRNVVAERLKNQEADAKRKLKSEGKPPPKRAKHPIPLVGELDSNVGEEPLLPELDSGSDSVSDSELEDDPREDLKLTIFFSGVIDVQNYIEVFTMGGLTWEAFSQIVVRGYMGVPQHYIPKEGLLDLESGMPKNELFAKSKQAEEEQFNASLKAGAKKSAKPGQPAPKPKTVTVWGAPTAQSKGRRVGTPPPSGKKS